MQTPWGESDNQKTYVDGIVFYSTPSHGGFYVSPEKLETMKHPIFDSALRAPKFANQCAQGWFEEDCDAYFVVISFPELFTESQVKDAQTVLKNIYPKLWGALYDITSTN